MLYEATGKMRYRDYALFDYLCHKIGNGAVSERPMVEAAEADLRTRLRRDLNAPFLAQG